MVSISVSPQSGKSPVCEPGTWLYQFLLYVILTLKFFRFLCFLLGFFKVSALLIIIAEWWWVSLCYMSQNHFSSKPFTHTTTISSSTIRLRAVSFFGRLHVNMQRFNFQSPDFCCNVICCFVRCCPRALHVTHLWCRCFDAENIGCQEIIGWDLVSWFHLLG